MEEKASAKSQPDRLPNVNRRHLQRDGTGRNSQQWDRSTGSPQGGRASLGIVPGQEHPRRVSFAVPLVREQPQAGPWGSQSHSSSLRGERLPPLPCPESSRHSRSLGTHMGTHGDMGAKPFPASGVEKGQAGWAGGRPGQGIWTGRLPLGPPLLPKGPGHRVSLPLSEVTQEETVPLLPKMGPGHRLSLPVTGVTQGDNVHLPPIMGLRHRVPLPLSGVIHEEVFPVPPKQGPGHRPSLPLTGVKQGNNVHLPPIKSPGHRLSLPRARVTQGQTVPLPPIPAAAAKGRTVTPPTAKSSHLPLVPLARGTRGEQGTAPSAQSSSAAPRHPQAQGAAVRPRSRVSGQDISQSSSRGSQRSGQQPAAQQDQALSMPGATAPGTETGTKHRRKVSEQHPAVPRVSRKHTLSSTSGPGQDKTGKDGTPVPKSEPSEEQNLRSLVLQLLAQDTAVKRQRRVSEPVPAVPRENTKRTLSSTSVPGPHKSGKYLPVVPKSDPVQQRRRKSGAGAECIVLPLRKSSLQHVETIPPQQRVLEWLEATFPGNLGTWAKEDKGQKDDGHREVCQGEDVQEKTPSQVESTREQELSQREDGKEKELSGVEEQKEHNLSQAEDSRDVSQGEDRKKEDLIQEEDSREEEQCQEEEEKKEELCQGADEMDQEQCRAEDSNDKVMCQGEEDKEEELSYAEEQRDQDLSPAQDITERATCQEEGEQEEELAKKPDSKWEELTEGEDSRIGDLSQGEGDNKGELLEGEDEKKEELPQGEDCSAEDVSEGEDVKKEGRCQEEDNRDEEMFQGEDQKKEELSQGEDQMEQELAEGEDEKREELSQGEDQVDQDPSRWEDRDDEDVRQEEDGNEEDPSEEEDDYGEELSQGDHSSAQELCQGEDDESCKMWDKPLGSGNERDCHPSPQEVPSCPSRMGTEAAGEAGEQVPGTSPVTAGATDCEPAGADLASAAEEEEQRAPPAPEAQEAAMAAACPAFGEQLTAAGAQSQAAALHSPCCPCSPRPSLVPVHGLSEQWEGTVGGSVLPVPQGEERALTTEEEEWQDDTDQELPQGQLSRDLSQIEDERDRDLWQGEEAGDEVASPAEDKTDQALSQLDHSRHPSLSTPQEMLPVPVPEEAAAFGQHSQVPGHTLPRQVAARALSQQRAVPQRRPSRLRRALRALRRLFCWPGSTAQAED